jgi:hypothetical protein
MARARGCCGEGCQPARGDRGGWGRRCRVRRHTRARACVLCAVCCVLCAVCCVLAGVSWLPGAAAARWRLAAPTPLPRATSSHTRLAPDQLVQEWLRAQRDGQGVCQEVRRRLARQGPPARRQLLSEALAACGRGARGSRCSCSAQGRAAAVVRCTLAQGTRWERCGDCVCGCARVRARAVCARSCALVGWLGWVLAAAARLLTHRAVCCPRVCVVCSCLHARRDMLSCVAVGDEHTLMLSRALTGKAGGELRRRRAAASRTAAAVLQVAQHAACGCHTCAVYVVSLLGRRTERRRQHHAMVAR